MASFLALIEAHNIRPAPEDFSGAGSDVSSPVLGFSKKVSLSVQAVMTIDNRLKVAIRKDVLLMMLGMLEYGEKRMFFSRTCAWISMKLTTSAY